MSWKKNNKSDNEFSKKYDLWYEKSEHTDIKKFRVRNWLKANREEHIHEFKGNY